jgi:hypothetical protein
LVPEKPKELTPTQASPGAGACAAATATGAPPSAMCGLSRPKCSEAGTAPCRSISAALIRPATPAAASAWPMLLLTEPTRSGRPASRPGPNTEASACISIGSPSAVPVPCAST